MIAETEETTAPAVKNDAAGGLEGPAAPMVLAVGELDFEHPEVTAVICETDPSMSVESGRADLIWRVREGGAPPFGARVCIADGLELAAEMAVESPGPLVVPRAEVGRVSSRFGFNPSASGSGFSTYHLDPTSVQAFNVTESGETVSLGNWLRQARTLGFTEVWLHGLVAQAAGCGFACDLLAKAHRLAPDLGIWLSGGGREPVHFTNAARLPGLVALVVEADLLADFEPGSLSAALEPAPVPASRPCGAA